MKDPNDTRDIGPRIGSPLWIYMTAVTVTGLAVLVTVAPALTIPGLRALGGHPLFWVIAALALVGELRPIVTPGKSAPDAGATSLTFCFAGTRRRATDTGSSLCGQQDLGGVRLEVQSQNLRPRADRGTGHRRFHQAPQQQIGRASC